MGHLFLSWHERPQQYSGSPFFTRDFSKFSPELQHSAPQPASAGALHGMPSSRKWSDLSIRKEDQSWTSQTPKDSYCGHFQNEFSLVQFLASGQKVCLDGYDGWDGSWEGGGDGCSCAFLQHSCVLHCKTSKTGLLPPLLARQTQSCRTGIAWLQGWWSAAAWSSPGRVISACLSRADGCLSGRKLCLSQGGKRGALVDYRSFRDVQLCFPVAAFTEVRS